MHFTRSEGGNFIWKMVNMAVKVNSSLLLLFGCLLHAWAIPAVKRATSDQHVSDVSSRFTKRSNGWASYYGKYPTGTGACSLDPMPKVFTQKGWIKAAAGAPDFQKSLGCGMCLKVEASGKPVAKGNTPLKGTYYAVINDLCGACGQGDLDLYIEGDGKWDISFDAIDCPDVTGSEGNIQYRFTGSNGWYLKLQITNSKQPTAAVEFFKGGKWHCAKRSDDNHFIWSGVGKIDFPLRTRLTSVAGETVGGDIPKLLNGKDQDSGFQYKPFKETNKDGTAPKLPCHGQGELVRDGNADDITSQGQSSQGSGSSGSTKPEPTDKPSKETKPDKEVTGSEGEGTKPGGGEQGGNETQPGKEGGEEKIENISDFCKTKSDGIYGDPTDCRYFIKCANSKTYRTKCANGLHWNDKIKNCDFPANAGCSKQNEKEQRGQQAGAGDSSQGNDESDKDITAVLKSKEERQQKQEDLSTDIECPLGSEEIARRHHPSDCSKFILCNGTIGKAFRCPEGFLYDKYRNKCREKYYVDCGDKYLQFRENGNKDRAIAEVSNNIAGRSDKVGGDIIETSSKSRDDANKDDNFCLGRMDGFYKFTEDCNVFYKCSRGVTKLKRCPEGLLFNEADEVCDWPTNVHC